MRNVDTEVLALFECLVAAHLVCLKEFLDIFSDSYSREQICELWLRFLLDDGKSQIQAIFESLVTAESSMVWKLKHKVKLSCSQ